MINKYSEFTAQKNQLKDQKKGIENEIERFEK